MNKKPNIIYILADDMGFGDVSCYDKNGKIPTPNLDKLAAEGIRYTDAHSPSAVCTPSRYGILTGRYCWRGILKDNVLWEWDNPILEPERTTLAQLYKNNGYRTACIGKWHLGWSWRCKDGSIAGDSFKPGSYDRALRAEKEAEIDYTAPIGGGPVDSGFDSYFGIDVPNFTPYTYFKDNMLDPIPTVEREFEHKGWFNLTLNGMSTPDYELEDVVVKLSDRVVDYIKQSDDEPFFLYYPLTGPHTPVAPTADFIGKSGAGEYGDFVVMMDWAVGEVMRALKEKGIDDNTLVLFTCDNGPEHTAYDRIREHEHYSMSHLRGVKRDCWEGGHRVPMIVRWKDEIKPGTVCDDTLSLLDFYATSAEILGQQLNEDEGEDSLSFLPTFYGDKPDYSAREGIVYHAYSGKLSLRVGDWVYIDHPTGDDNKEPEWFKEERGYKPHSQDKELYNLRDDIQQAVNLYNDNPDKAAQMQSLLREYVEQGRSLKK